jgi:hypothetical protein
MIFVAPVRAIQLWAQQLGWSQNVSADLLDTEGDTMPLTGLGTSSIPDSVPAIAVCQDIHAARL